LPPPAGTEDKAVRLTINNVSKAFGRFAALDDVSLSIEPGELVALLGPSGSGKTTLLRAIAGLVQPDSGTIFFDGEDVSALGVGERRIGFAFQNYALFRHMSVLKNVAFGLRARPRRTRPPKAEIRRRALDLLDLVQLDGLEDRFPSQLSGGQRQRVALARALAIEPRVLLLDEPFGALDAKVRKELRRWLRALHDRLGLTTVFVTHDQEEALELADRVVVMNRGRIEQAGTPAAVYDEPATPFVSAFLGEVNVFPCTLVDGVAEVLGCEFPVEESEGDLDRRFGPATAYVRTHEIELLSRERAEGVPAIVRAVFPFGGSVRVELAVEGHEAPVHAEIPRAFFEVGEVRVHAGLFVRATNARIFPTAS
jgi:sulfate transport system ATP-binding protein